MLAAANNAAKRPAHNASASSQASSSSVKLGAVNAQLKRESRSLLHEDEYQAEVIEHMHHMEVRLPRRDAIGRAMWTDCSCS